MGVYEVYLQADTSNKRQGPSCAPAYTPQGDAQQPCAAYGDRNIDHSFYKKRKFAVQILLHVYTGAHSDEDNSH